MGALGQADHLEGVEGTLAAVLEGDAGVEEPVGHVVQDPWIGVSRGMSVTAR